MNKPRGEVSETIPETELLTDTGFEEGSLNQSQAETQKEQQSKPWTVPEGARAAPHSSAPPVLIPPPQGLRGCLRLQPTRQSQGPHSHDPAPAQHLLGTSRLSQAEEGSQHPVNLSHVGDAWHTSNQTSLFWLSCFWDSLPAWRPCLSKGGVSHWAVPSWSSPRCYLCTAQGRAKLTAQFV